MDSEPKLSEGVEDRESLREWGHWQRHDFPTTSVSSARIHSPRVMTHTDSIPLGGQTITKSLAGWSKSSEMNRVLALRSEDKDEIFSNSQGNLQALGVHGIGALLFWSRTVCWVITIRLKMPCNTAYSQQPHVTFRDSKQKAFRSWLVRVPIDVALFSKRRNGRLVSSELTKPVSVREIPSSPRIFYLDEAAIRQLSSSSPIHI
jgi:hypothetical protein